MGSMGESQQRSSCENEKLHLSPFLIVGSVWVRKDCRFS
jgi:hypothetical protein